MAKFHESVEPCALCASQEYKKVAIEAGHDIFRCRRCGLVQVRPLPRETSDSNKSYWQVDFDVPAIQEARLGSQLVYSYGLRRLKELTGATLAGQNVLDVGCGMGLFLEIAKGQAANPYGIDIAGSAAQFAETHVGIDTVKVGAFETADFPAGYFQLITGWNVLEHTSAPGRWLAKAYRLLADDGLLLIKVPNVRFSALMSKLAPVTRALGLATMSYIATRPPLHLYGFSPNTLRKILEAAGFEVLTVEGAPVRESWGIKGAILEHLTKFLARLTGGLLDYQVVIMAVARKRKTDELA